MNLLRLYYFATYCAPGAVMPLMALALEARGFAPSQYAWLMALSPLSRLFAPPLWGALADRFLGTARLLRVNTLLAGVAMLALARATSLFGAALAYGAWAIVSSSLIPLADAGAYRMLGAAATRFGYVRVFGSIGFGVSAYLLGLFGVDAAMRVPFLVAAGSYLISGLVAQRIEDGAAPTRAPLAGSLATLARRTDVWLLWLGSVLYYLAHGAFDVYFGPHARRVPGVSTAMISTAWALGVGSEVVVLWFVPRMLVGPLRRPLLVGCALLAALRWWLVAEADSALAIWIEQPLHGITFGAWYLAFLHENQSGTPSALRATIQGVGSACMGLGLIIATLIGGPVLERFGGPTLFRLAVLASLGAAGAYALRLGYLTRAVASTEPDEHGA